MYAQSDRTDAREIVDIAAILGDDSRYAEQWRPRERAALPAIIELAADQQERFRRAAEEREREPRSRG